MYVVISRKVTLENSCNIQDGKSHSTSGHLRYNWHLNHYFFLFLELESNTYNFQMNLNSFLQNGITNSAIPCFLSWIVDMWYFKLELKEPSLFTMSTFYSLLFHDIHWYTQYVHVIAFFFNFTIKQELVLSMWWARNSKIWAFQSQNYISS